jgi:hypothetical protein
MVPAPGEIAEVPLASLLQFNSEGYYGRRIKVQGVVTEQKENSLFIQDGGASLYVKCGQADPVSPGDVVQVVGFPSWANTRRCWKTPFSMSLGIKLSLRRCNVRIDQLPSEDYDTVLVRLRGRLINRIERADEQILVLWRPTNLILNARLNSAKADSRFPGVAKRQRTGIDRRLPGAAGG